MPPVGHPRDLNASSGREVPVPRPAQNGSAQNGVRPNGAAPYGAGQNDAAPNGAVPNGAAPNGAAPNGAAPNGAGPNGAGTNGVGVNGTGASTARPPYGRPADGQVPNGRPRIAPPPTGLPPSGSAPRNRVGPPVGRSRPAPDDDQPTVVHGKLVGIPEPDEAPGRHRRRAGESPEGRPASAYQDKSSTGGRKARSGRRRRPAFWKELPLLIVVALLLTFLIQTFLAKVYVIPSGSMETTLHGCTGCNNDRVLVDKVTYRFSDPHPGDVVVFRGPDSWNSEFTADPPSNIVVQGLQQLGSLVGLAPPDEKDFVKRVIAVGGQTVQCCDSRNRVLVNGQPLDEPYIYYLPDAGQARQDTFGPVTIPQGELWMMGDSRNNSADSRVAGHGPVPVANVIGKARLIVLPFSRFGGIPDPNPQSTAVGMAGGPDSTAPLGVALVGAFPLLLGRRRLDRLDAELGSLLPGRRDRPRRDRSRR